MSYHGERSVGDCVEVCPRLSGQPVQEIKYELSNMAILAIEFQVSMRMVGFLR